MQNVGNLRKAVLKRAKVDAMFRGAIRRASKKHAAAKREYAEKNRTQRKATSP